jgi:hypothetical protein
VVRSFAVISDHGTSGCRRIVGPSTGVVRNGEGKWKSDDRGVGREDTVMEDVCNENEECSENWERESR